MRYYQIFYESAPSQWTEFTVINASGPMKALSKVLSQSEAYRYGRYKVIPVTAQRTFTVDASGIK